MCFFSASSVMQSCFSFLPPVIPLSYKLHLSPSACFPHFLPLLVQTCCLSLVSRCQVLVMVFFFSYWGFSCTPMWPCCPNKEAHDCPAQRGGIYKKLHTYRKHDIHFELCEQFHSLTGSLQKGKNHPLFQKGRKHSYTPHTLPLFFQWHSIHTFCTYTPHTQASVHFQIMSVSLSVYGTENIHLLWGMGGKVSHSPIFPRPGLFEATVATKI